MGLRLKILLGFLILALMLSVAGAWSIYEMRWVGSSVQNLLEDNYASIHAASQMIEALEREDSAVLLLLSGKWEQGRTIMAAADSMFQQNLARAATNLTVSGEGSYVDSIRTAYSKYRELWERPIVGTSRQHNIDWYLGEVHGAFLKVKTGVQALMKLNEDSIYQTATSLHARANRAIMPGILAIVSALVFTLMFNYFVNYFAVSPIVRITKSVRAFLERRVPFNVEIDTNDEFAELASAIKTLCALSEPPEQKS